MKQVLLSALLSSACLLLCSTPTAAQVVISEFVADNKTGLMDDDGQFSDWIELYNNSSSSVNLSGWALTDDPTHTQKWLFPSTNISAKAFLVVFASNKARAIAGGPLHTDFALRASGEYLALLKPDGTAASVFDTFPEQYEDFSYGISQDVQVNPIAVKGASGRALVPSSSTAATWKDRAFDDSTWPAAQSGVGYQTAVPGFAVYNYIANVGVCSLSAALELIGNPAQQQAVYAENAEVINYFNTGAGSHFGNEFTFPGLAMNQDQENFAIRATATVTIPTPGNWTFGVNSDDGFTLTVGPFSTSYPDPRGPGDTLQTFNFTIAGDYDLELIFYECGGGSEVELFAAPGSYGAFDSSVFRLIGDAANGGLAASSLVVSGGNGGAGYKDLIATDVQSAMQGVNSSIYLRFPFSVTSPAALQSLTLRMMYDDGYVAYLNGTEVARRNAPAAPAWNSAAMASHPNHLGGVFEEVNITDKISALQAGSNVLAIHGLNQSANDTDFLILPELVEYKVTNDVARYFSTTTPGGYNGDGFAAFVKDTKFSVDRGFFESAFDLSITSATPGVMIRYTTNGSVPSLQNGLTYTGPLNINRTTVLRAAAFKTGFYPSGVDTHTYIFPADVIRQSPNGEAPPGWPTSWGNNVVDYGMDPDIVNSPAYSGEIIASLKSLPSFSLVTDLPNLFDPGSGIYANPNGDGREWERPTSVELIYADGTKGFHIDGGLRIRGGYSRSGGNPKHGFRLFFRREYGEPKLVYPLFASQNGTDSFDSFDLRTFQNYSWSFEGDYRFTGVRDQWSRDAQYAAGHNAERGDYYHLYINGEYWGIYNTCERPEASYAESYFGGSKEDYDVIKVDTSAGYTIAATDGNMEAWTRLWTAATQGFSSDTAFYRIQGLNLDGTPNAGYENLLDVDNLIDYMLVIFFAGNLDAPVSAFIGETNPNNMYAVRNRTGSAGGFRFFSHDGEHTLHHESAIGGGELYRDRTGPFPAGDPLQQGQQTALARSNPHYVFTRLTDNAEFRLRLADHIQKQFFNGGVFTTEGARALFVVRSNQLYSAIVAESARWGDSKREPPRNRNQDWRTEMNRIYGSYFGNRPAIVLQQLRDKGWFPSVVAPSFSQYGGNIASGFRLSISAPAGTIYYTRDGSDPRLRGGGVSSSALTYDAAVELTQSTQVKARVLSGGEWSPLTEGKFYVVRNFTELLVTEIMYNPLGTTNLSGDAFEFLELKNVSSSALELSGLKFTNGISYEFPIGTVVPPGKHVVLVSNPVAFSSRYPGVNVAGVYTGQLSNSGEQISLVHVDGKPVFSFSYGESVPWPLAADGDGFSLVPLNPNLNPAPETASNWRASTTIGGSPGTDDPAANVPQVIITEILTHTDLPEIDKVELYNPYGTNVYIAYWYLSDDREQPKKYQIPVDFMIPARSFAFLTETMWNADPSSTNSFRLSSTGEEIYLSAAGAEGGLLGYSDGFSFGAAQNGVTFGRYTNSVGEVQFPAQKANTFGAVNAGPKVGPIVINEIMYKPPFGGDEFIELKSITNSPIKLYDPDFPTNTWRLDGVGFSFPPEKEIPPLGLVLLVGGDPASFRAKYGVPPSVQIFGPYPGALQGNGETLALTFPDHPNVDLETGLTNVPYIDMDVVRYDNRAPWPTNADGFGSSLERTMASAYGNDPANWRDSPGAPSPGLDNTGNRSPLVNAGADRKLNVTNLPYSVSLQGSMSDDGLPGPPATTSHVWSQVTGPASAVFGNVNQLDSDVLLPALGTYVLRLTASDGELQAQADVRITLERSRSELTFVSKKSEWKYLDNGSNPGIAWRGLSYNDASWASGQAPIGYGDYDGTQPATTIGFGPDGNNKYITSFFRRTFTLANAASVTNLALEVQRDDGVVVYLNGTAVFTNNMPTDQEITYLTPASSVVGGSSEAAYYSAIINAGLLVNGTNVIAAEVHQSGGTSSDLIFDLELHGEAYPPNQKPQAIAGTDQQVDISAGALLGASVTDDGLPIPPGVLTMGWTKVSGPGSVSFGNALSPATTASFSATGTYVLRFAANDGALAASDDISVVVTGEIAPAAVVITYSGFADSQTTDFRLQFTAAAGVTYTVQFREKLNEGSWQRLADVSAQTLDKMIEVSDPNAGTGETRFYRIVNPKQP